MIRGMREDGKGRESLRIAEGSRVKRRRGREHDDAERGRHIGRHTHTHAHTQTATDTHPDGFLDGWGGKPIRRTPRTTLMKTCIR